MSGPERSPQVSSLQESDRRENGVCPECHGRHGRAFARREASAQEDLRGWIHRLHPGAWVRFGDLFAYDVDLLIAKLPGRILFNDRVRCVGTICVDCCDEDLRAETARRARDRGISWACRKCGSKFGLAKVYESTLRANEVLRALFPWSGSRRAL